MNDTEVIERVGALRPTNRTPPPRPHPSMNPGGFSNGRGVYEVEEEILRLHGQLAPSVFQRLFQWQQWKLWAMWHTYWPTTIESILADRREYLASLER